MNELVIKNPSELAQQLNYATANGNGLAFLSQQQPAIAEFLQNALKYPPAMAARIAADLSVLVDRSVMADKRNGKGLLACQPKDLVGAVLAAVSMGLSINPSANECYIVPMGGTATLIPTAAALIKMATQNKLIAAVEAHVVYLGDVFEYSNGDDGVRYKHKPDIDKLGTWADIRGVVVSVKLPNGATQTNWINKAELEKRRLASPMAAANVGEGKTPYDKWPAEMAKTKAIKSALKRLATTLPIGQNGLPTNPAVCDEVSYVANDNNQFEIKPLDYSKALSAVTEAQMKALAQIEAAPDDFELKNGAWKSMGKRNALIAIRSENPLLYQNIYEAAKAYIEQVDSEKNNNDVPSQTQPILSINPAADAQQGQLFN